MARYRKSDPRWRGEAAAEVMAEAVASVDLGDRVLLAGEANAAVVTAVLGRGAQPAYWLRRAGVAAHALDAGANREWPGDGPFACALLRLPRAKDELDMMLHAVAARLAPEGILCVYGANDEGIKSAAGRMQTVLGHVDTIAQRAHCRVLTGRRSANIDGLRSALAAWRRVEILAIDGQERAWLSYPGAFAHGNLDPGTRLLLAALAGTGTLPGVHHVNVAPDSRILDYGCGTGVIAAHMMARYPSAHVAMLDCDALAIAAARENVRGAEGHVAESLRDFARTVVERSRRFDLIVSNPPIHAGKSEDYTVLGQLIAQAPERLAAGGSLVMVVQGRVPVERWLSAAFGQIEVLAQDSRYRVWHAKVSKNARSIGSGREGRATSVKGRPAQR